MKRQLHLIRNDGVIVTTRQVWLDSLPGVVLYEGSAFILREPNVYYEATIMEIDPPKVTHLEVPIRNGLARWPAVLDHLTKVGDQITLTNVHRFKPGLYMQAKKSGVKIKMMLTNKGLRVTRVA